MPYYTDGDQFYYRRAFDFVAGSGFLEGFDYYKDSIGSSEPVLFVFYYFSSFVMNKDLLISIANGVLGFGIGKAMLRRRASPWVLFLLPVNYYLLVLMFSAERLKFSILFLLSFFLINSGRRWGGLLISILAHSQIAILYIGLLAANFFKQFRENFNTKLLRQILLVLVACLVAYYYVGENAISKLEFYSDSENAYDKGASALLKPAIFWGITLLYCRRQWVEASIYHAPILIFAYFVGSERLVIFSYGIFMFYALGYRRGINFGVISSSIYFAYQGVDFLSKIVAHGNGYFGAAH